MQDTTPIAVGVAPAPSKVGAGTLVFPDANPYTGQTLVDNGILAIQNNAALGGIYNTVQTVNLSGPLTGSFRLTFNGKTTPVALSSNYTATNPTFLSDIQTALNGLPSVVAAGGSVVVTWPDGTTNPRPAPRAPSWSPSRAENSPASTKTR